MGPDAAGSLPTVSYRIIDDDSSLLQPAGVQSEQSRSYGFNDYSDFERPEHYIRYIEPIESELSVQVEYDMDEQDQVWLDALNVERKKDQCGPISYEVFEIIMDKLEKEWFNLSKRIPKPDHSLPAEDSKCSVCDDGEGENSNAIVFCDGCNLAVHQDCYGVPYIPEGQWLCRKCTVSPENPVSCVFCPNEGGAFKQTTTGHWAHLLCAIWIPETSLGNAIYMEPVEGLEHIPKSRWKLVCSLCKEKVGACIQCDNRNCFTAFHPTCARQMGLLQTMKSLTTDGVLRAYCHRHLPVEEPDVLQGDGEGRGEEWDARSNLDHVLPPPAKAQGKRSHKKGASNRCIRTPKAPIIIAPLTKKSAQAHSKSFRPGPPVIPKMIVNRILDYVGKVQLRKKPAVVEMISRYWSLKREMRRGAPLLKRLHLEPWTASTTAKTQTEAEKTLKLKFLQLVRNDLEKVRMLAELVRKREKEKLRQVQVIKDLVDGFIFPNGDRMRVTLEKISALDRRELFLNPVTEIEAPDYFKIIKEPRCWLYIDDKLERNLYIDIAEFKRDVTLVMDNAMTYNGPDTPFYRAAEKLKKSAEPLLAELDDISAVYQAALPPRALESVNAGEKWPVGDLEASLARLSPFLNPTPVPSRPDAPQDLLSSLFATELAPPKPPTPSPSPAPITRKGPTVEERKAKWRVREAEDREQGLVRATRNRQKLELDFAKEAGLGLASPGSGVAKDGEGEALMIGTAIAQNEEGKTVRRSTRGGEITESPKFTPRKRDRRPKVNHTPAPTSALASAPTTATPTEAAPQSATRASSTSLSSTHPDLKPLARPQQGVVGLEAIPIMSDRERREQELALALELEGTDVGGLDQFKRFNVGWVLPEGSKRRRTSEASSVVGGTSNWEGNGRSKGNTSKRPSPAPSSATSTASARGKSSRKSVKTPEVIREEEEAVEDDEELTPLSSEEPEEVAKSKETQDVEEVSSQAQPAAGPSKVVEPAPAPADDESDLSPPPPARSQAGTPQAGTPRTTRKRGGVVYVPDMDLDPEDMLRRRTSRPKGQGKGKEKTVETPLPDQVDIPQAGVQGKAESEPVVEEAADVQEQETPEVPTQESGPEEDRVLDNLAKEVVINESAPPPPTRSSRKRKVDQAELQAPHPQQEADKDKDSTPRPAKKQLGRHVIGRSELASLEVDMVDSPQKAERLPEVEEGAASIHPSRKKKLPPPPAKTKRKVKDPFPPGTLVWAKVYSFPHFPAEIVDLDDPDDRSEVPDPVLAEEAAARKAAERNDTRVWLVRFYDSSSSYGWIAEDKLDDLGESDEVDGMYLSGKMNKFKSQHMKKMCKKAYREAMASMASSDEEK